jgi:hypothetical protein
MIFGIQGIIPPALHTIKLQYMVDIEKLEDLPKKMGTSEYYRHYSTRNQSHFFWNYHRHSAHHLVDGLFPYTRAIRVIESNIGKSFDNAFSYFCKLVPRYQQKWFLEKFEENRRGYWNSYYIDDNGNIQANRRERSKRLYPVYSKDYKTERVHKITGKKFPKDTWWWKSKVNESDYHYIIVSGSVIYCESANDPRFVRYHSEKKRSRKKDYRERKKLQGEKALDALNWMREKRIIARRREKEENLVKIISHGFDPKTSFRN